MGSCPRGSWIKDREGEKMYIRYHTKYFSPKTSQPVGLFVAVWHLLQRDILTKEEVVEYWRMRKYSEEVLPIPPFYADGNLIGAVTWFKENDKTKGLLGELSFYFDILNKYNIDLEMSRSDNPGKIIYEDEFQVGVLNESGRV